MALERSIDCIELGRRVLAFFNMAVEVNNSSLMPVSFRDASSGYIVDPIVVRFGAQMSLYTRHLDVFLVHGAPSIDSAVEALVDSLGEVERLEHSIDVESFMPLKTVMSPFYGCKCLEEIAVKLDLLGHKVQQNWPQSAAEIDSSQQSLNCMARVYNVVDLTAQKTKSRKMAFA